jgi:hypothetical protein
VKHSTCAIARWQWHPPLVLSIRANTDAAQNLMALPSTFLIGKRYTIIVSVTVFLATNI